MLWEPEKYKNEIYKMVITLNERGIIVKMNKETLKN